MNGCHKNWWCIDAQELTEIASQLTRIQAEVGEAITSSRIFDRCLNDVRQLSHDVTQDVKFIVKENSEMKNSMEQVPPSIVAKVSKYLNQIYVSQ